MSRSGLVLLVVGIAALGATWALSAFDGTPALPSYLAAWLLCLGIPAGALALVMAAETLGFAASPALKLLRGLTAILPLMALLGIPLLIGAGGLYQFGEGWLSHRSFVVREIAVLVVWSLLALVFLRPPARMGGARRALAVFGVILQVAIASIMGTDWALSLDPHFGSTSFGLLIVVSQMLAAAAMAALLRAIDRRPGVPAAGLHAVLLVLLAAWVFMVFTQFLIVWSANLPSEVVWYQRRDAGLGRLSEWVGVGACFAALLLMLPRPLEGLRLSVVIAAALLLVALAIQAFWLVTPAFRSGLVFNGVDLLTLVGLGAVLAGGALALGFRSSNHAVA